MLKFGFLFGVICCTAVPASAAVVISYEAPNAINTTVTGSFAVETFESATPGFNQNFSDVVAAGGHAVTFDYNGVAVRQHDQFSGLGTGHYGATYSGIGFDAHEGPSFALDVASTGGPINFFGAYFSATDTSNTIRFYKSGALVEDFTLGELWAGTTGVGNQDSLYVNFTFTGGATYDHIVFSQPIACCGFESDNHTVGTWHSSGNTIIGSVPEPASWAMMVGGFGMMGATLRRRRTGLIFA